MQRSGDGGIGRRKFYVRAAHPRSICAAAREALARSAPLPFRSPSRARENITPARLHAASGGCFRFGKRSLPGVVSWGCFPSRGASLTRVWWQKSSTLGVEEGAGTRIEVCCRHACKEQSTRLCIQKRQVDRFCVLHSGWLRWTRTCAPQHGAPGACTFVIAFMLALGKRGRNEGVVHLDSENKKAKGKLLSEDEEEENVMKLKSLSSINGLEIRWLHVRCSVAPHSAVCVCVCVCVQQPRPCCAIVHPREFRMCTRFCVDVCVFAQWGGHQHDKRQRRDLPAFCGLQSAAAAGKVAHREGS